MTAFYAACQYASMIEQLYDAYMSDKFTEGLSFNELLRACRDGYGISQRRAAEYLEIPAALLRRLESVDHGQGLPQQLLDRIKAFYRIPSGVLETAYASWQRPRRDPDFHRLVSAVSGDSADLDAWTAVSRFSPRVRRVYQLMHELDSVDEVAKRLGIRSASVRCYIADAKAILHAVERDRKINAAG